MVEVVKGREVTITFDATRCVHSRNCVLGHPEVFVPNVKGDWIYPDAAPAATVLQIGVACPSGAIRVTRNDGTATSEVPPVVNTLRLRENGPLSLEAPMLIGGVAASSVRATLCRCGASRRKPFCDGSHAQAGFVASGEPPPRSLEALRLRDGPLAVRPRRNGPLELEGALELCAGTGRVFDRTTTVRLCRCGQSKTKPWCDGSHVGAGFTADGG